MGLSFLVLVIGSALLFVFGGQGCQPAEKSLVCPELPGGLDPRRLVVLASEGTGAAGDAKQAVFLEDLEELLLSADLQVLPATSAAAEMPSECISWKLEFAWQPASVSLAIRHRGRLAAKSHETRAQGKEAILPALRAAVFSRLEVVPRKSSPSLHDPRSPLFESRLLAMRFYAEGRTGEAAAVLRDAVERNPADSALAFRLGRVATAWALEKAAIRGKAFWMEAPAQAELDDGKSRLWSEALIHLDWALKLDAGSALAYHSRGQVHMAQLNFSAAERDFRQALAIWPAFADAASELATLAGQGSGQPHLELLLEQALKMVDSRRSLRGELLGKLGHLQLRAGKNEAAAALLGQALGATPAERRQIRLELLAALTEAQLSCGKVAEACSNWRAYELLVGADDDVEFATGAASAAARLCR